MLYGKNYAHIFFCILLIPLLNFNICYFIYTLSINKFIDGTCFCIPDSIPTENIIKRILHLKITTETIGIKFTFTIFGKHIKINLYLNQITDKNRHKHKLDVTSF